MYYVELSLFITVIIRQQRVNEPFQMSTSGVCSVKFIARYQWFAVAAGDAKDGSMSSITPVLKGRRRSRHSKLTQTIVWIHWLFIQPIQYCYRHLVKTA